MPEPVASPSILIRPIQDALTAYLAGKPGLAQAKVITRKAKQTRAVLREAMANQKLAVLVFPPVLRQLNANNPGPWADLIEVRVRVVEYPDLNDQETDCEGLLEQVLIAIDGYQLTIPGLKLNPLYASPSPVRDVELSDRIAYDIVYFTSGGLPART